jgi:hypothetical protein
MEEIFETVAGSENEATYHSLVQSSAPIFASILSAQPTQDNMGIQAEACELINHIMDGRQGDIGSELGPAVWKPLFDCAMATEDQATVQVCQCGCNPGTSLMSKPIVSVRHIGQVYQKGRQCTASVVSPFRHYCLDPV